MRVFPRVTRKQRTLMRTFSGEHGRLEDLLRFDERLSSMPVDEGPGWFWRSVGIAIVLALVADLIAHLAGYAPPLVLLLAISAGIVALRLMVNGLAEPVWRQVGNLVRSTAEAPRIHPGGWYTGGQSDGMLDAIRRWDRRLEWGATSPERYAHTVAPRLGELADQRLRQRYGLTRATDPGRARALLGEPLWAMLHPAPGASPTARELAAVLGVLGQL